MEEALSPFDQALKAPFLDQQPITKRWSLFSQSTTTTTATSASSSSSVSDNGMGEEHAGRRNGKSYTAPIEEIVFTPGHEGGATEEEEGAFVLAMALEEGRVVDSNHALMRERHEDISQIHSEMQQLNQIQRELAMTVDSQQDDVDRMCYMAVESGEQAEMGLNHLVTAHRMMMENRKRKRRAVVSAVLGIAVVATMHWAMSVAYDENGSPDEAGYHP